MIPAQRSHAILPALALMAMVMIAYWPAMQNGGFIWDDDDYVLHNKTLVDGEGLKDIWFSPQATPQYYPLVHTSYWIEYRFWELDPTGYHVVNVLLHALGSVLLWRVLLKLGVPGAWLAAALFAIHPVHVESVAWITERKNVLSGVFYLGSALIYLHWAFARHDGNARKWAYCGALSLYICALLSKTVTASLPAALLLVFWWMDGKKHPEASTKPPWLRSNILPLIPFFLLGIGLSAITVWLEKDHVGASGPEWDFSFIDRCLIAGRALWFYIGKLVWPFPLCFNYTRWEINAHVWWQYLFPLSYALLLALFWRIRVRMGRGLLVAALFFAGTLFPALGFLDVYPMRYSFVADHFQYLASIGVLTIVAAGMTRFLKYATPDASADTAEGDTSPPKGNKRLVAVALLILIMLGIQSSRQCDIYQGLEALWRDTIRKNPDSFLSYNNLAQMAIHEGDLEKAIPLIRKCLEVKPDEVKAINNLGIAMVGLGNEEEGRAQYRTAMEIRPDDPQAYHNLGALEAERGDLEKAIELYRKALERDSSLVATHINLGMALAQQGNEEESLRHHRKAVELEPHYGMTYFKYGETLRALGRIREAADQFRTAISIEPSLAMAHYFLGSIAVSDQLLPAAADHFHQALHADSNFVDAHVSYAKVLAVLQKPGQAEKHFTKAISLAPESGRFRMAYGSFLAKQGNLTEAKREFLVAAERMPKNPEPALQAGLMDLQLGNAQAAETRFLAIIRMAPGYAPTYNHLAVLRASQGNNRNAIELLQHALKLAPNEAEFLNNLGVILVRSGKHGEALKALERAVQLRPSYDEARKNLEDLRRLISKP